MTDVILNQSSDGTIWGQYINTNVQGGDPSVVKLSDTSYLMICVGQPNSNSIPMGKAQLAKLWAASATWMLSVCCSNWHS